MEPAPQPIETEPYEITPARGRPTPLVFASPHSGRLIPSDMDPAAGLSEQALRSAEDALVDRLIAAGPDHGAPLIVGRVARAYLDLNRDPAELDPALIAGLGGAAPGPKAAAGLGVAPRRAGDGSELYDRRLSLAEVEARIARVHRPYHRALAGLIEGARTRHGRAVLVDWHSMPSRANAADVVLGDRHGTSCRLALTRRLKTLFEQLGWRVALNHPYAGGYTTQTWGRPAEGYEAIQVEISRTLYLDETKLEPGPGFGRCRDGLEQIIATLAAEIDRLS